MKAYEKLRGIRLSEETINSCTYEELREGIKSTKATAWAVMVIAVIFFGWLIIRIVPAVS